MREVGIILNPSLVIEGDHTMEGGMRALAHFANRPIRPTAVMCSNDMTAIGVIREAFDCGIAIPRQLSVIGFDDVRLAEFVTRPLTTIRMSQTEIARIAFKALLAEVERERPSRHEIECLLQTNLVLRKSTAPA
jgi:DNA-binding LacI/PurR family transcriptional regulator